jgi:hypothetical protein
LWQKAYRKKHGSISHNRLSLLANPANKLLMLVAMAILVAKSLPQETWRYLAHWVTTINKVTGN